MAGGIVNLPQGSRGTMGGGRAVSGSDPSGCSQEEEQEETKEQEQGDQKKMAVLILAKALITDQMLTEGIMLLVKRVKYA